MKNVVVLLTVFTFLIACTPDEKASTSIGYTVDETMADQIRRQLSENSTADSLNVRIIVDDSVTFSSYETPRRLAVATTAMLHKDTIHIDGFLGGKAGLGYSISIFKDGITVYHTVRSASTIYKLTENDGMLRQYLEVPCTRAEVVLSKKPRFTPGEIISGKVQLSSQDYYEKVNGKTRKYKVQLTAFFKTEPVIDNK